MATTTFLDQRIEEPVKLAHPPTEAKDGETRIRDHHAVTDEYNLVDAKDLPANYTAAPRSSASRTRSATLTTTATQTAQLVFLYPQNHQGMERAPTEATTADTLDIFVSPAC